MCELFGANLKQSRNLSEELKVFYSHSVKHPHGWGMMRKSGSIYEIETEPVRAIDSEKLKQLIQTMEPQKNMLAHIRLATVGSVKEDNCHPFVGKDLSGRTWTMIHNGTIYSSKVLIPYLNRQKGDTDSERVFLYLLDLMNEEFQEKGSLEIEQRFRIVSNMIKELSARNKLNTMIFDGEILYIHKNMKSTLSFLQTDNGYLFATTPLSEDWTPVPMCKVQAYQEGQLILQAKDSTEEFVPTLEYISAMAAMHI